MTFQKKLHINYLHNILEKGIKFILCTTYNRGPVVTKPCCLSSNNDASNHSKNFIITNSDQSFYAIALKNLIDLYLNSGDGSILDLSSCTCNAIDNFIKKNITSADSYLHFIECEEFSLTVIYWCLSALHILKDARVKVDCQIKNLILFILINSISEKVHIRGFKSNLYEDFIKKSCFFCSDADCYNNWSLQQSLPPNKTAIIDDIGIDYSNSNKSLEFDDLFLEFQRLENVFFVYEDDNNVLYGTQHLTDSDHHISAKCNKLNSDCSNNLSHSNTTDIKQLFPMKNNEESSSKGFSRDPNRKYGFMGFPDRVTYDASVMNSLSAIQIIILLYNDDFARKFLASNQHVLNALDKYLSEIFKLRQNDYFFNFSWDSTHQLEFTKLEFQHSDIRFFFCGVAANKLLSMIRWYFLNGKHVCMNEGTKLIEKIGDISIKLNQDGEKLDSSLVGFADSAQMKDDEYSINKSMLKSEGTQEKISLEAEGKSKKINPEIINNEKFDISDIVKYILSCQNSDGGFSSDDLKNESHAGMTFCAISALYLLESIDSIDSLHHRRLIRWLSERQNDDGGMSGRVGKSSDVCYCWWVLACLKILGAEIEEVVETNKLVDFILRCQNPLTGGFCKTPYVGATKGYHDKLSHSSFEKKYIEEVDDVCQESDPFHTFFAICALSILNESLPQNSRLISSELDPLNCIFALPYRFIM